MEKVLFEKQINLSFFSAEPPISALFSMKINPVLLTLRLSAFRTDIILKYSKTLLKLQKSNVWGILKTGQDRKHSPTEGKNLWGLPGVHRHELHGDVAPKSPKAVYILAQRGFGTEAAAGVTPSTPADDAGCWMMHAQKKGGFGSSGAALGVVRCASRLPPGARGKLASPFLAAPSPDGFWVYDNVKICRESVSFPFKFSIFVSEKEKKWIVSWLPSRPKLGQFPI